MILNNKGGQMYKVSEIHPPKFPDIINIYRLILDDDAVPGKVTVSIHPCHKCVMADGTEKQVFRLSLGDEIIIY